VCGPGTRRLINILEGREEHAQASCSETTTLMEYGRLMESIRMTVNQKKDRAKLFQIYHEIRAGLA